MVNIKLLVPELMLCAHGGEETPGNQSITVIRVELKYHKIEWEICAIQSLRLTRMQLLWFLQEGYF